MRIPIKALKEFSKKYSLSHLVVFAQGKDYKNNHVVTYGRTIEQCSESADFGNRMKKALKWPESLQLQPSRVRKLQKENEELKESLKKLTDILRKKEEKLENWENSAFDRDFGF